MAETTTAATNAAAEEEFVLTPEIMAYENRRYDYIICAGVLLVAFFLASFEESGSDLWLRLASGYQIAAGGPGAPATDTLTYTVAGRPWVNPSWAFDWSIAQLWGRFGGGTLVAVKALVVVLAPLLLLTIRYKGPTLWWTAVCTLAAAVAFSPWLLVAPEVVSLVFTALLLLIWFTARHSPGRFAVVYLAVPLAAVWANFDLAYVLVAAFLLVVAIGEAVQVLLPASLNFEDRHLTPTQVLMTALTGLLAWFAGCATPYGFATVSLPIEWIRDVLPYVSPYERRMAGWVGLELSM
ncbi:MAG: hypothetical protein ACRDD1_14675, partial [Planctomycetia bacterium]